MPSCEEYWHMGDTTTRFSSASPRSRNGWNMGGRGRDVVPARRSQRLVKRNPVLHGELGAGADGEMRGRLGVADQHHVVGDPALAANGREIAPDRAVGDQPMALQLFCEQAFDETRRRGLIELVEAGAREGVRIG